MLCEKLNIIGSWPEIISWTGQREIDQFWTECPRVDWMLLVAKLVGVPRVTFAELTCQFARQCVRHAKCPSALAAIEAAEALRDEPTSKTLLKEALDAERAIGRSVKEADYSPNLTYKSRLAAWTAVRAAQTHRRRRDLTGLAHEYAEAAARHAVEAEYSFEAANGRMDSAVTARTVAAQLEMVRRQIPVDLVKELLDKAVAKRKREARLRGK